MAKIKLLSESALAKKYPNSARAEFLLSTDKTLWIPSSCIALNWQTGGGLQYGKVHELFGYESTGKSLLAMDFARNTQKLGGVVLWGDAESSWNSSWAESNGINLTKTIVYEKNDIEGFSDWHRDQFMYWRARLTKNQPILVVCDSIAALDCLDNLNSSQLESKAEMGNRAKAIYKMYRLRVDAYKKYGITILMINQVRKKVGATMFEASETTPGGDSTKFFSSIRIGLNASKQIKGYKKKDGTFVEDNQKGRKVGRNIYIQIAKNKLAPPKDSVRTQVYFLPTASGYTGYSRYHGLPEILLEEGVIRKEKGGRFYRKDKLVAHGEENLLSEITANEKMRKFLIEKAGVNTLSKTREKIDLIKENLFPVKIKESDEE